MAPHLTTAQTRTSAHSTTSQGSSYGGRVRCKRCGAALFTSRLAARGLRKKAASRRSYNRAAHLVRQVGPPYMAMWGRKRAAQQQGALEAAMSPVGRARTINSKQPPLDDESRAYAALSVALYFRSDQPCTQSRTTPVCETQPLGTSPSSESRPERAIRPEARGPRVWLCTLVSRAHRRKQRSEARMARVTVRAPVWKKA